MGKFIIFTFAMLAWGFYEMSGGADFEPQVREVAEAPAPAPAVTRSVVQPTLISLNTPVRQEAPTPAVVSEVIAPIADALVTEAVVEAVAETEVEPTPVVAPVAPAQDLRYVDGTRVNMRVGPGTNFGVVSAFDRGTEAEVMLVNASGWAQIRILSTGQTGWMAERLLAQR